MLLFVSHRAAVDLAAEAFLREQPALPKPTVSLLYNFPALMPGGGGGGAAGVARPQFAQPLVRLARLARQVEVEQFNDVAPRSRALARL